MTAASPIGVVLAGGRGRRLGGGKPLLQLAGRPLIAYPLAALREALDHVAVLSKGGLALDGVEVWVEPAQPQHPLAGIVHALRQAAGRAVFVCAADMPLLGAREVREVCAARDERALAVVPRAGGRLQPLCAVYEAGALAALELAEVAAPLSASVHALRPRVLEWADETPFFNVNTAADLQRAGELLRR